MRHRTVVMNDKMQKGYRYVRTAPVGRNFDLTDTRKEFPWSWFIRAKLRPRRRDRSLNFFGVAARDSGRQAGPGNASNINSLFRAASQNQHRSAQRDPIPYALETDWPVGAGGFKPLHFRIGNCQTLNQGRRT